jgi:hypothetical protein
MPSHPIMKHCLYFCWSDTEPVPSGTGSERHFSLLVKPLLICTWVSANPPSALPATVRDVGTHKGCPYPSELLNASISSIDSVSETSWKLISGASCPRSMAFKIPRYRLD